MTWSPRWGCCSPRRGSPGEPSRTSSTTSRYASFTLATSSAGTGFGAPPLLDGALRVHVVNIQELAPSAGFDIAGLFGGIGAFVGNLLGGVVGGTLGSITLAKSLGTFSTLAERIERIIDKLGLGAAPAPAGGGGAGAAAAPKPDAAVPTPVAAGGSDFLSQLESLRGKVELATGLLRAANGAPTTGGGGAGGTPSIVNAPDAERWRAWVDSVTATLATATRLVGGLVIAVPTVVAGVAWLFDRLPDFRNAITETLRFVVRNTLVLTQAVVVLALETVAMTARVAAMAIRSLAATVDEALASLFAALAKLLDGALQLGGILAGAITKTVNQLLDWLVPKVDEILRHVGELRVFRLLSRLIDVLPALLLLTGNKAPPPAGPSNQPAGPDRPPIVIPPPPDLEAVMAQVGKEAKTATDKLTQVTKQLVDGPTDALQRGLTDFGDKLDKAAEQEASLVGTNLSKHLAKLGDKADEKTRALLPPEPGSGQGDVADRLRGQTAFHPIAAAYGQWLATGGFKQLLDSMTGYFAGPDAGSGGPAAGRTPISGPMVLIDEVVIDIGPPGTPAGEAASAGPSSRADGSLLSRLGSVREQVEREERADERRGSLGQRRPHVPIWDFATP